MSTDGAWVEQLTVYRAVARAVADLVAAIDDPGAPGLGEWTVVELAGHTMRALTTVERYLAAAPVPGPELEDAAAYVARYLEERRKDPAMDVSVAARGREEAAQLGDDPATVFGAAVTRVAGLVEAAKPDLVIPTAFASIRLGDYLRTRVMELVLHGLDLAAAIGVSWRPPPEALLDTLGLLSEVAVRTGRGEDLARLLGGRASPHDVLPIIR